VELSTLQDVEIAVIDLAGSGGLEQPLAQGSRSVVFASSHGSVVKVPTPETPSSWISAESVYCDAAHSVGAPAPKMLGMVQRASAWAIQFERIDGLSMWDNVTADPTTATAAGRRLAETHVALRSLPVPLRLPELRSRVLAKLHSAKEAIGPLLPAVVELLATQWSGLRHVSLCHGDLHPQNVLEPGTPQPRAVLVDWFDASRGPWIADVARTSLLLDLGQGVQGSRPSWLDDLHVSYLETVRSDSKFDENAFREWRVIGAASRLAEGIQIDLTQQLLHREVAALA
jgi:hypothetical protein